MPAPLVYAAGAVVAKFIAQKGLAAERHPADFKTSKDKC